LGATLVLGFSVGLALTLVLSGTLAALSVNHLSRRFHGFGAVARKVPYLSGALIMLIGAYVAWQGLSGMGNLSATALHGHP
jgi:nickel/cobalt exporter